MARSQHVTRRALHEAARWNYDRPEAKRERLTEVRRDIAAKRRIKYQVRAERRGAGRAAPPPVEVEAIPIRVLDQGPCIHYPASAADVREVLRRLPAGAATGIEAIEFALGKDSQREYVVKKGLRHPEADPYTGRHGLEFPPGLHNGHILGTYFGRRGLIQLYAYVYDPATANLRIKETWLKLRLLSTLVHEVAHHDDRSRRLGRGRWRFDDHEKNESFAERAEHEWMQEAVIPYLADAYPELVAEIEAWIEEQGGIRIPWSWLEVDPRISVKGGPWLFGIMTLSETFAELLADVESGRDRKSIRLNLAENLHFGDRFELALEIVEALLAEEPNDLQSLTAKADYLNHLDRNAEAAAILRHVLAQDPGLKDAWHIQGLVCQDTKDWAGVLEATTHELRLADHRSAWTVASQARALLEMGRFAELAERVRELKARSSRQVRGEAFGFEALAFLRTGRLAEALRAAAAGLAVAKGTVHEHELLAVRYEVLCRTGRRKEAGILAPRTLEALERRGYDDWARRLREL